MPIRMPDTILKGDHPRTIPPKFGPNPPSGFRGEDFFIIVNRRRTTDDGRTDDGQKVMTKAHMAFYAR